MENGQVRNEHGKIIFPFKRKVRTGADDLLLFDDKYNLLVFDRSIDWNFVGIEYQKNRDDSVVCGHIGSMQQHDYWLCLGLH